HTGVCVFNQTTDSHDCATVTTEVKFRSLTIEEIKRYVDREDVLGCAGSAKSEGFGIALLDSIHGPDPTALIGLPLITLTRMLRDVGISLP
ncbi:MAG: Maf family protein, partial [Betaproteobacteria bacterium]